MEAYAHTYNGQPRMPGPHPYAAAPTPAQAAPLSWMHGFSLIASAVAGFALASWYTKKGTSMAMAAASGSKGAAGQLNQLASMTVLSIDSGDLKTIKEYADTGAITDATTNPLFVAQAGLSGDPDYIAMVDESVAAACSAADTTEARVELAMDILAVTLGTRIAAIVEGYVSTEVDPRLSFDKEASLDRARRIIDLYKANGIDKSRVLIKLAATWEGIEAARELEKEGVTCNLTLIFGHAQAVACAQAGVRLISPFPGRVLDYHNLYNPGRTVTDPEQDEGVMAVKKMHHYFKSYGHEGTILMPASWRPSRGTSDPDYMLDEIRALAGVDRMTLPPALLEKLAQSTEPLPQLLRADEADKSIAGPEIPMDEKRFRYELNMDGCATTKMAEGLRAFIAETQKLEKVITEKVLEASK